MSGITPPWYNGPHSQTKDSTMSKPYMCPACEGKAYYQETVLYKGLGGGPTYDCHYCGGTGGVSEWGWVYWHYWIEPPWYVKPVKRLYRRVRFSLAAWTADTEPYGWEQRNDD